MNKKNQKNEALRRMKKLDFHQNVYNEFETEGKLNLSEKGGLLYWLNKEQLAMVKTFEEESGNIVYHIIHSFAEFGELYTMFYVSKHEEEWESDFEDLSEDICCAYVKNVSNDCCSEYGSIMFRKQIGGLVRIA